MPAYVLVHGDSHGAWCWDRLVPILRAAPGVEAVLAVDLPGHGTREGLIAQDRITHQDYVDSVVGDIAAADLSQVVLVGHSLAGITIPQVAHRIPERIQHLVYLTTTNPPLGDCVNDSMKHPLSPISRGIDVTEAFCSDLDRETSDWLLGNLGPQPPGPLEAPIEILSGPEPIPATYVLCEKDEVLLPAYQLEQARRLGIDHILRIDSGHSPFASQPEVLAALLLEAVG
ncbi:MAG: hypothetical protein CL908_17300 [Deltaproteobacteria bacterium]|nr:hypothetical protein [Deltaproteobacteria bacterium]